MLRPALVMATLAVAAGAQFTSRVDLVEVYATVSDRDGRPATGLTRDEFVVREDGVPQEVSAFSAGDFPLSVALAIDSSFSMAGERLAMAKSAAHVFAGELRPDDEVTLLAFGSEVETLLPLTRDRPALHAAITGLTPFGSTALHDAIVVALERVGQGKGRRALVVLSDSRDRYSKATAEEVVAAARSTGVLAYPIGFGDRASPLFDELARVTGGRSFNVPRADRLTGVFRSIAEELRHQYLLGYVPSRPVEAEGRFRRLQVEVKRPGFSVRARAGYVGK